MHAVTVKLQDNVYSSARQLAEREGLSLEQLIEAAITERASRPSDAALKEAYEILAEDAETVFLETGGADFLERVEALKERHGGGVSDFEPPRLDSRDKT